MGADDFERMQRAAAVEHARDEMERAMDLYRGATDRWRRAQQELLDLGPVVEPDPVEHAREHGGIEVVLAGSDEERDR